MKHFHGVRDRALPPTLIIIIIIIAVEITKLVEYVDRKEEPLIQVVRPHQHNTDSAVLQTARCLRTEVQRETRNMKDNIAEKTKERWHGKRMQGQLPRNLDEKLVDIEQSYH